MSIYFCDSLEEVFNLEGITNGTEIHNLEELDVSYCDLVKEVIQVKKAVDVEDEGEIIFTKLRKVSLNCLPNLKSFCSTRYAFKFPTSEEISVEECPNMEYLCKGVLSTPMLQGVKRDNSGELVLDLNIAIVNMFKNKVCT